MSEEQGEPRIEEAIWRVMEWLEEDEERMELYEYFLDSFYGTFPEDSFPVPVDKMLDRLPESIEAWFVGMTLEEFLASQKQSVTNDFLADAEEDLSPEERLYIESLSLSVVGFYEVVDVVAGESLTLRDMVKGGEPIRIADAYSSELYHRWNVIGGRVVELDGQPFLTAFSVPLDRHRVEQLAEVLRHRYEVLTTARPAPELRDYHWVEVLEGSAAFAALSFALQAYSDAKAAERERYVEFRYALRVPAAQIEAKLKAHREFALSEGGAWALVGAKPSDPPQGWVVIEGGSLSVEAESVKRCKAIAAKLEKDLKLKLGKFERIEHEPGGEEEELSLEDEAQLRALPDLLAATGDVPMEELGGQTPRAAVATEEGRLLVVRLLKETERSVNEQLGPGKAPVEFERVWRAFGLAYPSGEAL